MAFRLFLLFLFLCFLDIVFRHVSHNTFKYTRQTDDTYIYNGRMEQREELVETHHTQFPSVYWTIIGIFRPSWFRLFVRLLQNCLRFPQCLFAMNWIFLSFLFFWGGFICGTKPLSQRTKCICYWQNVNNGSAYTLIESFFITHKHLHTYTFRIQKLFDFAFKSPVTNYTWSCFMSKFLFLPAQVNSIELNRSISCCFPNKTTYIHTHRVR